jgi:type VI secretion system protein ImpL
MKQILIKIFKVFLILALSLLALLLIFGLVLILGWPWWVGFFILLGFGGISLGIIFARKILLRRREQNFVQQVIDQDDSYLKGLENIEKEKSKELQDRWKEAMQALRKSHLKKMGNPLYVLPWYLIIGESASGKTTAIKSARLSSPFAELSRTSGISGTRNCDWWFFEQAIILDTAGRYAIPVDEGRDKDEWQKFLSLLIRFRKKEPINGLVVTVAADKVIAPNMEVLEEDGRNIRKRIDELMLVLGAKFPVYLLVTKCDLIKGMTQFCDNLSEKNLDQPMGFLNQEMSRDVMAFHEQAVSAIGDRLRDLRLLIFQRAGSKIDPELLLFPEEFERIKPGLDTFIKAAFQENPYQETPVLRGIFYSSGRQEGSPYSHFMNSLGLIDEKEILPGTNKGLFLKDFFSKILPKDRGLFTPTQRSMQWNRLTRNLGLTSWMAIAIALCGLLSFSFVKNLSILKDAATDFTPPPVLQGEIFTDLVTMDHFRQAILSIEESNNRWWIPRFLLTQSLGVEKNLKEKYCSQFRDGFLVSFDKHMLDHVSNFSNLTPDEEIGQHAAHLVRRINLLNARLEGQDLAGLGKKPQPSFDTIVVSENREILPELREQFHGLYLYNLVWRDDTSRLNQEMTLLRSWLKHLLDLRPNEIHWLVKWMNREPAISDIVLKDFWGGSLFSKPDYLQVSEESRKKTGERSAILSNTMVHRAFTSQGKEMIEAFIQEMEAALPDPILIASRKTEFERWYKESYFNEWYKFAEVFPKGVDFLDGKKEWQQTASIIATDKSPYFAFLDTMAEELVPFYGGFFQDKNLPSWIDHVFEFHVARSRMEDNDGEGIGALKDSGIVNRATKKVRAKITEFQQKTGLAGSPGELEIIRSRLVAAEAYEQYKNALKEITPIASSRRLAFQMAGVVFGDDPVSSTSPFFIAQNAVQGMKTAMTGNKAEQPMFWELVKGPWNFLWEYATQEASCQIRSLWEEDVLVEVQGISDLSSMANLLLGQDGLATKFVNGPAKPFVGRSLNKGYHPREALGKSIPFESSFFEFMTEGSIAVQPKRPEIETKKTETVPAQVDPKEIVQSSYLVNIKGLPTHVNSEAQIKPHVTNLHIKCANQDFNLVNWHFPVQKTIDWSPNTCGNVDFSIEVGSLVLARKYTGPDAFPKFLLDFPQGTRTFNPKDFPTSQASLERLGISYIKVNYQFKNHEPVIELFRSKVRQAKIDAARARSEEKKAIEKQVKIPSLPRNITLCWD